MYLHNVAERQADGHSSVVTNVVILLNYFEYLENPYYYCYYYRTRVYVVPRLKNRARSQYARLSPTIDQFHGIHINMENKKGSGSLLLNFLGQNTII